MNTVSELTANIKGVSSLIEHLEIDTDNIDIADLDTSVLDWYEERFKMLKEDGCQEAILAYLKRLMKTDVSDTTRLYVMRSATMYLM